MITLKVVFTRKGQPAPLISTNLNGNLFDTTKIFSGANDKKPNRF
jgi:hypothetical protein